MYDSVGAAKYNISVNALGDSDHEACLADLRNCLDFLNEMKVLDAGSGTGALCLALAKVPGLEITALEPSSAMIELLRLRPELNRVKTVTGFCDHVDDASLFAPESFNLVVSRLLVNNLYDPLAAFRNWHAWLRPGGVVVVMDGLFDRGDWQGEWSSFVDELPLSASRTTATVPYLLEQTGFQIDHVGWMEHTNALPSTKTKRYLVAATKKVSGTFFSSVGNKTFSAQ